MIAALLAPLLAATPVMGCERDVVLPEGLVIPLLTAERLSSKHAATGDMVALTVAEDVKIDGVVAIPAGTPAKGQVADASGTGALGTAGKLMLRRSTCSSARRSCGSTGRSSGTAAFPSPLPSA
jgi:hypothetical protein